MLFSFPSSAVQGSLALLFNKGHLRILSVFSLTMSVFKRLSASTKALSSTVSSNMVAARSWSLVVRSLHAFKACGWRRLLTVSTIAYKRMNTMTEVSSEPTELSEIQAYMLLGKQGSKVCASSVLSQPPLWHAAAEVFIILFCKNPSWDFARQEENLLLLWKDNRYSHAYFLESTARLQEDFKLFGWWTVGK